MNRRRSLFHFNQDEGGGGGAPAADAGWAPTQEWGSRIDSFIDRAGPTLDALGSLLTEPDPYAGQQQYGPPGYQPGYGADPYGQQQLQQQVGGYANDLAQQGYAPEQIQQMIGPMIQQAMQEQLGAFMPLLGQVAEREGETVARNALTELAQEIGEFNQDDAILMAQGYLSQGMPPGDALKAAAQYVRQREEAIAQQAVEAFKASFQNAASARGELGAGGAAVEGQTTHTGPGRYEAQMQDWLSRRSPDLPQ